MTRHDEALLAWLRLAGLRFNPFTHLESSADAYLLRYLVIHPDLAPVWRDVNAVVVAPIGGGKTALRLYAAWNGLRGLFSFFPISYVLQEESDDLLPADIQAHGAGLARATAKHVFLFLATMPHRFLNLSGRDQRLLADLLASMTDEYPSILTVWEPELWEILLGLLVKPVLKNNFTFPRSQDIEDVRKILERARPWCEVDSLALTRQVIDFLREKFHYGAIHFLLDGVDGFAETVARPERGAQWLEKWMEGFFAFFPTDSVRLKVFTPPEMIPTWDDEKGFPSLEQTEILWNRANLVEMLRRRIYVASDRVFETLDALCDESVIELEEMLVDTLLEAGAPLPRELLALMQDILRVHTLRSPKTPYLSWADVETSLHRFQPITVHKKFNPILSF